MIVPVILSGGSGTRLWPLSRPTQPKQLLPMVGTTTMLRATIDRANGLPDVAGPLVVCNIDHRVLARHDLAEAGHDPDRVVLEPVGRNTAPAVGAAALMVTAVEGPDAVMLVLPADHVIEDGDAFKAAVTKGLPHAIAGSLVTFGIVPQRAETGYGYIRTGDAVADGHTIDRFVEKPDAATAQKYVDSGNYLWNSGMFLFTAASYLRELADHQPEMLTAVRAAIDGRVGGGVIELDATAFSTSPSLSIDYAVMEYTTAGVVIPLDAGWSDVGSWAALHEVTDHDDAGNAIVGDVTAIDTTNSYLRSSGRLVAAVGMDGVFVVDTPDAVIVAPLDRSQDVKKVVDDLNRRGRPEASTASAGLEPWGSWRRLSSRYSTTMELVIDPGATVELENHHEIVVVRGPVTAVGAEVRASVGEGEVIAATHPRITNEGTEPAVLIVVEVGGDA